MNILRMVNPVQPYLWGSQKFIQTLLNKPQELGKPFAELWMGAHPKSPSKIQNGEILVDLDYIIAEDPQNFIGYHIASLYKDHLPFLLKVLAAEQPLSLQVHPNQKQAKAGYLREEKLGIPIGADNRSYKDAFHKPELLVALTNFFALCGFRDYAEMAHLIKKYLPKTDFSALQDFVAHPDSDTLKTMYSGLLNLDMQEKKALLNDYLNHIRKNLPANPQEQLINEWSAKLYQMYPDDIGVLSPLLLNVVSLKAGEGLFLQSGVLHSYLQGAGIEIMANSDNVLRGGLTTKYVDICELLRIVDFQPQIIRPIKPHKVLTKEKLYQTTAKEFALSFIRHISHKMTVINRSDSPEILFCYKGSFVIENCSQFLTLEQGQSVFVPYETEGYVIDGKGILYRARVNS